jgi:outer membrane protein TolC
MDLSPLATPGRKLARTVGAWMCAATPAALLLLLVLLAASPPAQGEDSAQAGGVPENGQKEFWSGIRVLELDWACRKALEENPGLRAAAERIKQARAALRQARAGYWPSLGLEASGSRDWLSESDLDPEVEAGPLPAAFPQSESPVDASRAALTARWLLFSGFERRYRAAAASFGLERSLAGDREAARLLLSGVAESYYSALLAAENESIARADERFNRRQLREAQARRRAGAGSLSDVLNFRIRVNTARAQRISAENERVAARAALSALLGAPRADMPASVRLASLPRETQAELRIPDLREEVRFALRHRPDLEQRKAAERQAGAEADAARADYFPALSLSYSLEGDRTGAFAPDEEDFGHSVALTLSFDLFDGGLRAARVREARSRRREVTRQREDLKLRVGSDVRQAMAGLSSARDRLVLERSNLELVRRTRDLVAKEYAAGQASLVRLNEAQRDLTAAEGRLARALVSLRLAGFRLDVETGRIVSRYRDAAPTDRAEAEPAKGFVR